MGNGKLDPRSLNAEERAIVLDWFLMGRSRTFEDAFRLTERTIIAYREFFGQPASEGGKVECPNCLQKVPGELEHWHSGYSDDNCTVGPHYICAQSSPVWQEVQPANAHARSSLPGTNSGHGHAWPRPDGIKARCGGVGLCKICSADALLVKVSISEPAQPEPVAAEMPEAVSVNTWQLEELLKYADLAEVSLRTGFHPPEFLFEPADRSLRQCIDAIKEQRDQWRTHSAQPAKVRMTKELRRALDAAEAQAGWHMDQGRPKTFDEIDAAIAAVRAQAAEAGKVRLPKVREGISLLIWKIDNAQGAIAVEHYSGMLRSMLAELDTAEGRK